MNFFCTWKHCLQPASNRFCDVTLHESNLHAEEVWLCPDHWGKAKWSGRLDLKEAFLESLVKLPLPPEVVYQRPDPSGWVEPEPEAPEAFVVVKEGKKPKAKKSQPRKLTLFGFSVARQDGSGISAVQHPTGHEILPKHVPYDGRPVDD